MKFIYFTFALAAISQVRPSATNTLFTQLLINDIAQGNGTCIRMPISADAAANPVTDLNSNDMACG